MKIGAGAAVAVILTMSGFLSGCVADHIPSSPADRVVAIEEVIRQVQVALAGAQGRLADRSFPPLKEVKLTLQTVATAKEAESLRLWVLTAGGAAETSRTQQLTLTLVPPPPGPRKLALEPSLSGNLEAAIVSAAEAVAKAGEGPVPLAATAAELEIGFTAKRTASGGAGVILAPLTIGASGEWATSAVQSIRVSFATR